MFYIFHPQPLFFNQVEVGKVKTGQYSPQYTALENSYSEIQDSRKAVTLNLVKGVNTNDEQLTKLLVDFTMEKTDDDKSWDVSRDIMETGKLLLNENNREELVHFQKKSIADFVQIKRDGNLRLCKSQLQLFQVET